MNKSILPSLISLLLLLPFNPLKSQLSFEGLEHLFTPPKHYTVHFTTEKIEVDGRISDKAWENAPWIENFVHIEGEHKPAPPYSTRMKMLWDEQYLYIAAEFEDPHVWSYMKNHDEALFNENCFEVFLDPDNNTHIYFEILVNASNTVFDLCMSKPYRNGGGALLSWHASGMKTGVEVQGTLNNPDDTDKGWTLEMAIPFTDVAIGGRATPQEGRFWRANFARVHWQTDISGTEYVKKQDASGRAIPADFWLWSPHGILNMHYPERFGYLIFTRETDSRSAPSFVLPLEEKQRKYLWLVYYRQQAFRTNNQRYAASFAELGIDTKEFTIDETPHELSMEATNSQFIVFIRQSGAPQPISLNHEGLVRVSNR
jgi:hypothetical protein